jgi:AcrR family transcriptional regulator
MASRRAIKAAETRIGILEATLERLDERPLAAISAKELAEVAGVSPATFFNYFPSKDDILALFVQLWTVEMAWRVSRHPEGDPLGAIELMFVSTAQRSDEHPGILAEIVAYQTRNHFGGELTPPTDEDLRRMFPDCEDIEQAPREAGLQTLVPPLLTRAVELGHLHADTPVDLVFAAIATIFFGAPVLVRQTESLSLEVAFTTQLRWLWAAHAGPSPR